jgi:cell division protease FtsH
MDPKIVAERKERLIVAGKNLKKHFVGIDYVIDDIIKKIEIWYCYPEFLMRPTVICLWGTTGIGKTDLIKRLAQELGFIDKFTNIELDNFQRDHYDNYSDSILDVFFNNGITTTTQGILLLDEIQRYRTINKDGGEIKRREYDDIWKLLSDGKLITEQGKIKYMKELLDAIKVETRKLKDYASREKDPDKLSDYKEFYGFDIDTKHYLGRIGFTSDDAALMFNLWMGEAMFSFNPDKEMNKIMEINMKYKMNMIDTSELLRNIPHTVFSVFLEKKLQDVVSKQDTIDEDKYIYSKMLIFISGNLDDVFCAKDNVNDRTIEEMCEFTSKITDIDVKNGLLKLFRPEQVARFNNNYIIYHTLTRQDFSTIISREIDNYAEKVFNKIGVHLNFDKAAIIQKVFDDGIYSGQGVRPLFSSVSSIIGEIVPSLLIKEESSKTHY